MKSGYVVSGRMAFAPRGGRAPPGMERTRGRGSALVELIAVTPFVLLLLAGIWDIREFVAHRTQLAREIYGVAQAIAAEPLTQPVEGAVAAFQTRLMAKSKAGRIRVAIVKRGTRRHDGSACTDTELWCAPQVATIWPTTAQDAAWKVGNQPSRCDTPDGLPAPGARFGADAPVLPHEDTGRSVETWASRNIGPTTWWVVVDVCVDPEPGLFLGRLPNLATNMLDTSFAIQRRAAWQAQSELRDCKAWCDP